MSVKSLEFANNRYFASTPTEWFVFLYWYSRYCTSKYTHLYKYEKNRRTMHTKYESVNKKWLIDWIIAARIANIFVYMYWCYLQIMGERENSFQIFHSGFSYRMTFYTRKKNLAPKNQFESRNKYLIYSLILCSN